MAVDWTTYKSACDQPDHWSRWMLEQSALMIEEVGLANKLLAALMTEPIPKPNDHSGPIETDMFVLRLPPYERDQILLEIHRACAAAENAVSAIVTARIASRLLIPNTYILTALTTKCPFYN